MSDPGDSGLRFGILGPLRVSLGDREIELASRKRRTLLAALLMDAGSTVSTDRLADILWGGEQPADPAGAVQTHVSRLRMLFEKEAGSDARQLLVTQPSGYLLAADPLLIDAAWFERRVDEARAAPSPHAAAELLERALRLWRGPALAGFDHEHLRAAATRLDELRLAAVELRAAALIAMHHDEQAVRELEDAAAQHPLREHLRGQLMIALTRCGRQADALAAYRDLRDRLVEGLGVDPSAPLRHLEQAILQQADELPWPTTWVAGRDRGPSPSLEPIPAKAPTPRPSSLPEPLTSFVGRDADVEGVTGALASRRIVVLTGVGELHVVAISDRQRQAGSGCATS